MTETEETKKETQDNEATRDENFAHVENQKAQDRLVRGVPYNAGGTVEIADGQTDVVIAGMKTTSKLKPKPEPNTTQEYLAALERKQRDGDG